MTRALQVAGLVLLVLLCAVAAPVALHMPGWCRGVDHLQEQAQDTAGVVKDMAIHAKGLVTEVQRGAKRSAQVTDDTGTAVKQFTAVLTAIQTGTLPQANKLLATANGTLATTGTTVGKVGGVADAVKGKVDELDVTAAQEKAGKLIDAYTILPPAVTAALQPLPGLELSLTRTTDALDTSISNPKIDTFLEHVDSVAISTAALENSLNMATGHIDARFFAPWDGTHPFRHHAAQVGKFALGLAEPAYYGLGVLKGQ